MEVDRDHAYDQAEGAGQDEEEYSEFPTLTMTILREGRFCISSADISLSFQSHPAESLRVRPRR